jgi:hypothetical protein
MMPAIYYGLLTDQSNPRNTIAAILKTFSQFGVNCPSIVQRFISLASG